MLFLENGKGIFVTYCVVIVAVVQPEGGNCEERKAYDIKSSITKYD